MLDKNDQTFIPLPGSAPMQAVLRRVYLQTRHLCAAKVVSERADSWRMSTDQTRQCWKSGNGGGGASPSFEGILGVHL